MSYLIRNSTGRNNILYSNDLYISSKFRTDCKRLIRSSDVRNDIGYITDTNATKNYRLLNRTANGRNDIQWKTTTLSYYPLNNYKLKSWFELGLAVDMRYDGYIHVWNTNRNGYYYISYLSNGWNMTPHYTANNSGSTISYVKITFYIGNYDTSYQMWHDLVYYYDTFYVTTTDGVTYSGETNGAVKINKNNSNGYVSIYNDSITAPSNFDAMHVNKIYFE